MNGKKYKNILHNILIPTNYCIPTSISFTKIHINIIIGIWHLLEYIEQSNFFVNHYSCPFEIKESP